MAPEMFIGGLLLCAGALFVGATLLRSGILHLTMTPAERLDVENEAADRRRFAIFRALQDEEAKP